MFQRTGKFVGTCLALAIVVPGIFAAEPDSETVVDLPPSRWSIPDPPARPRVAEEASNDEINRANERWRAAYQAWREALSPEQLAEHARRKSSLPGPDDVWYDWRAVAQERKLSANVRARLDTQGFIATEKNLEQVFQAYLGSGPYFITSDAVLNAYHVLLEDSVVRLEARRAFALRRELERAWRELPGWAAAHQVNPSAVAASVTHVQCVLGPALVVLGSDVTNDAPHLRAAIATEVARIRAADAVVMPPWLGAPTPAFAGIDFHRMQPPGPYTTNAVLADYFRAMRWLQAAPFRADHDDELIAFAVLASVCIDRQGRGFFDDYSMFLGDSSPLSLSSNANSFRHYGSRLGERGHDEVLQLAREHARRSAAHAGPNERIRSDPPASDDPLATAVFTIIGTHTTPDAALLGEITTLPDMTTRLPSGLMVAGMLGFALAAPDWPASAADAVQRHAKWRNLAADEGAGAIWDELIELKQAPLSAPHFSESTIWNHYLNALAVLAAPADPAAPGLFASPAWHAKQANTALAGWAQMRATWTLHVTEPLYTVGRWTPPTGFVEPVPDFFQRFAAVIEMTRDALEQQGALGSPALDSAFTYWEMADFISTHELDRAPVESWEETFGNSAGSNFMMKVFAVSDGDDLSRLGEDQPTPERWAQARDRFTQAAHDLLAGENVEALLITDTHAARHVDRRGTWNQLARMVRRLEALSQKQLRQAPWSDEEDDFVRHFGEELAHVMLYEGDAHMIPRDDAPRVTPVATHPLTGQSLHAGIGRPREFYVLYPWRGVAILCRGAVVPYLEVPSAGRLNDTAWKALLDREAPPAPPAALAPLYAPR